MTFSKKTWKFIQKYFMIWKSTFDLSWTVTTYNIQNGDKILCICIFILSQLSQDLVPFILLLSVSLSYFCTITFLPNFRFLCQGNHNRMTQDLHTYIKENTTLNLAFAPILDMVHWVKQNKKKMNPVVLENMLNKL